MLKKSLRKKLNKKTLNMNEMIATRMERVLRTMKKVLGTIMIFFKYQLKEMTKVKKRMGVNKLPIITKHHKRGNNIKWEKI